MAASFAERSSKELVIANGLGTFVRNLEVASQIGAHFRRVESEGDRWVAAECEKGCRVRYQYALAKAAKAIGDVDLAAAHGDAFITTPPGFLLRPAGESSGSYRFSVNAPTGVTFVTGVSEVSPGTYGALAEHFEGGPYAAVGALESVRLEVGASLIEVVVPRGARELERAVVDRWIDSAAGALAGYLGRFPVPSALVLVLPVPGDRIHGRQLGVGGASVLLWVGDRVSGDEFDRDWIATHELVHLAVPSMARRHLWLSEGLATYVEPVARQRAWQISAEQVWVDLSRGLPKGLPVAGDRGLDHTPTWGRTYWGGALFALLADVEIRKATAGRFGLQHALRGVIDAGGSAAVHWPIERFLDAGDSATGTDVLRSLYNRMKSDPYGVDLDALFRELGVVRHGHGVRFDDTAPLASIRRGITPAARAGNGSSGR